MANVTDVQLSIAGISNNANLVKVTVKYKLAPTQVEKLAGSVFQGTIQLMGVDGLAQQPRFSISDPPFAVNAQTNLPVQRTRVFNVAKSVVNEDPETTGTGSEVADEILAKVTVVYAASAPIPPVVMPPVTSPQVAGTWK